MPLVVMKLKITVLVDNIIVKRLRFDWLLSSTICGVKYAEDVNSLPEKLVSFVVFVFFLGSKTNDIV